MLTNSIIYSQANKAKVIGKVVDSQSNAGLSYSSIRVFNEADRKLITGNIADRINQSRMARGVPTLAAPLPAKPKGSIYAELVEAAKR